MRCWLLFSALLLGAAAVTDVHPLRETDSSEFEVDDPAIWRNPVDASRSLIVGTVKQAKPNGALNVYSLEGRLLESARDLDRPNNVDVLGDLAAVTERLARQVRFYRVQASTPRLRPLGAVPVFAGEPGEAGAPMGISLYRRKRDGATFAIVSRKTGPGQGYLWQYRLSVSPASVTGTKVRSFGAFSASGEIEAVAVDPDRELVYYSDEDCCVRVYRADPDARGANVEVARFAQSGFRGNREGIAIAGPYVIVTDQQDPRSEYHVFRRSDRKEVGVWRGDAQSTDGIDALAVPLGPLFPQGVFVAMNNTRHSFQLYQLPRDAR